MIEWQRSGPEPGKDYSDILYDSAEGIAKITINRPEVRNAFRPTTLFELSHAFNVARDDPEIGVIILTGAGEMAFCSGGDQRIRGDDGYQDDHGVGRLNVLDLQVQIRRTPKPVIAMVAGYAIGGGHVLHVCCDLTIAADNAIFGQTGPKVGSFDGGYGSWLLASTVGLKKAREIWYLCRQYDARQALEMGLVNAVVPLASLEEETISWAREMLAKSPLALRMLKGALNAVTDGAAGMQQFAGDATLIYYMSEEAQEGRNAYQQKRTARLRPLPAPPMTARPQPRPGPAIDAVARTELLPRLRAFAIPMTVRFRGIEVREGALIEGPPGGGSSRRSPSTGRGSAPGGWPARWSPRPRRWPAPVRDRVPVNVTVPAVGPAQAIEIVTASGCRTAKVKVAERGQAEAQDIERVEAVREALGPGGAIRVDANGGWEVGQAARMLRRLAAFGLEYAEQPCATLDELAELRRLIDIPVAADESIRKAEDPLRVRAADAADIVVLKVQPLGGVRPALRVAEACGLPVVVSSAVDTSVGLAAGVALAAALPELPYACGLGTMSLLTGDVTADPLVPDRGELPVRRPGVDPARLARFETDPGPWRDRAAAAARYLPDLAPAAAPERS